MVVVSEETSAVSLAVDGKLEKIDDLEELRGRLSKLLTGA
jgi:DNA integrity scanning protein DisA with diadenylate cyclase activity